MEICLRFFDKIIISSSSIEFSIIINFIIIPDIFNNSKLFKYFKLLNNVLISSFSKSIPNILIYLYMKELIFLYLEYILNNYIIPLIHFYHIYFLYYISKYHIILMILYYIHLIIDSILLFLQIVFHFPFYIQYLFLYLLYVV